MLKWFDRADPTRLNYLGQMHRHRGDGATEPQLSRIDLHLNAKTLRDARISIMDLIRIISHAATDDEHLIFIRIVFAEKVAV